MSAVAAGSIVHVQHDVLQSSVDLVSDIIDLVRLKGYTIVPLETCLYGAAAQGSRPRCTAALPCVVCVCGGGAVLTAL